MGTGSETQYGGAKVWLTGSLNGCLKLEAAQLRVGRR